MFIELNLNNPAHFVGAVVLLAGFFDVLLCEPPTPVHPVVWIGKLISVFEHKRPRQSPRAELAWGILTVIIVCGVTGGVAYGATRGLQYCPMWVQLLVLAYLLKTTFSLRGLIQAGLIIQRKLHTDTDAAREELKALVSRNRNLEPPQIVSATVESMAENLTDSVLAPLLAFAFFGLPGAAIYRAINTMDAMIGYRGEYEYVGKCAARVDDIVNWIPARMAGVILCLVAVLHGHGKTAIATLVRDRRELESPNAAWTMAPMAGALRVQLEKVGHYRLGSPQRPLTGEVIGEAAHLTGFAGAVCLIISSVLGVMIAR